MGDVYLEGGIIKRVGSFDTKRLRDVHIVDANVSRVFIYRAWDCLQTGYRELGLRLGMS